VNNNNDIFDDFDNTESKDSDSKIVCSKCGTEVDSYQIIENNMAYCKNCHEITKIKDLNKNEAIKIDYEDLKIINTPNKLLIEIIYLNRTYGLLSSIVTIAFFIMASAIYVPMISFIIYLAAIAMLYFSIISLMDKLYIEVTKKTITVYSKPIPYFKTKVFDAKNITQVYVKEVAKLIDTRIDKNYGMSATDVAIKNSYSLIIIDKNKNEYTLLTLNESRYLGQLEKTIEGWLKIKDIKVDKEYRYK